MSLEPNGLFRTHFPSEGPSQTNSPERISQTYSLTVSTGPYDHNLRRWIREPLHLVGARPGRYNQRAYPFSQQRALTPLTQFSQRQSKDKSLPPICGGSG